MEVEPRVAILQDLRLQSFDAIRFASYRTASKLRYIQKSTNRKLISLSVRFSQINFCFSILKFIWLIYGMLLKHSVKMV